MRRRTLLSFGAAGALALASAPLGLQAQTPNRRRRVGFLSPGVSTSRNVWVSLETFLKGMSDHGWVEGRDFDFAVRFGENQNDRLPLLARELVALAPDVLVAAVNPAQNHLHDATKTIPIVFALGGDPVLSGLAASHNRPGGNVTGVMNQLAETFMPKLLQFAHELVPGASRIGMPFNGSNPESENMRKHAEAAAKTLNVTLMPVEVRVPDDLDAAFAKLAAAGAELILPTSDNLFWVQSKRMGALAFAAKLPWIGGQREQVLDGAILGYGVNVVPNFRRAASFVDRILKGARPGDLPIEFPTTFDMVVNLKVARALGISIPQTIMIYATEVIE
jgi:putative tryptophan/tyrosine transport system substrate-binding protein